MKQQFKSKPRSRYSLYLALALSAITLMWLLKVCSSPHPHRTGESLPSGGDTIDVAIEYSPLSFYRYGDTLGGFNYEVLKDIARQNGLAVKFHPIVKLSAGMRGLENGSYDIVVADLPMTSDYREHFSYSEPVYLDRQVLVQRVDSANEPITNQLDLANKEVWVMAHSPIVGRLRNLAEEIGDTIIIRQDSLYGNEQLFLLTATGDIPRSVVNEKVAKAMAADYPDMDVSTSVSFTQFQSWLMRKDDVQLRDSVDTMIRRFKESAMYDSLTRRYFGE